MSFSDELRKLAERYQAGDLTGQEFAAAKQRLIADSRPEPEPPALPPAPPAEAPRAATPRPQEMRVVITDINMRFSSMIIFMVKWAFAAIPAIIIIYIIVMIVIALGVGLLSHS